jgi:hypothetical protein
MNNGDFYRGLEAAAALVEEEAEKIVKASGGSLTAQTMAGIYLGLAARILQVQDSDPNASLRGRIGETI